jgi:molybdopterin synthase sulfur carrier subunit
VITVRLFAAARAAAGVSQVEVAPGPVTDVVRALAEGRQPRFAEVLAVSAIVSDGVRLDPASGTVLAPGVVVDVLPPFAGG